MSTVSRARRPTRPDDLARILLGNNRQREWELGRALELEFEDEGEFEGEGLLSAPQLASAVQANRSFARQIGWGCIRNGRVTIQNPALNTLLGLVAGASEDDIAQAIERWQVAQPGGRGDGQLGPQTWQRMRPSLALPTLRFPYRQAVTFGGRQLGIIEKTMPYVRTGTATSANFGVGIELGFRATNMDAVRRSGFVDVNGEDQFRWIQVLELRRIGIGPITEPLIQFFRRRAGGRIIDPTLALLPPDAHPYYFYEGLPTPLTAAQIAAGLTDWHRVERHLDLPARNGLCYDAVFEDFPSIPKVAALPGRRAYFNFETALVGVRPGRRNVILNTVLWGFDIILNPAGVPTLGVSPIRNGPFGGSAGFKRVMNAEFAAGTFPTHCFIGSGYSRAATCT